ncbi:unnamed protein product [Schistosoma margrebowiei]|uniref:Uncharacterized protein n=1 Tax=Schistosoma margrebowiei TaxID=48269 RepID=A0A183MLF6_9TREM|nr:unnamed protein product [Schistosoma margrebowiei]
MLKLVVGGSQQETLDPGFVLLGTRQQGENLADIVLFNILSRNYYQSIVQLTSKFSTYIQQFWSYKDSVTAVVSLALTEKTTSVATASTAVSLNIHKEKSKIHRYNTACTNPITIDGEDLEDVKAFTYLGSIIDEHGGSDVDVKAYLQLKNIWNSKQLSVNQHQGQNFQYNTNVKTVLLYGAETWRTTKDIIQKIQVFNNSCLRKMLRIRWPDTISNNVLWERTN